MQRQRIPTLLLLTVGVCLSAQESQALPEFGPQVNAACQSFNGSAPFAQQGCMLCHTSNTGNFTQRRDPQWAYWEKQALTFYCSSLLLRVEEPVPNDTYTGVASLRGFALALQPHEVSEIQWLVDDQPRGSIPYGGSRQDVANAFSGLSLTDPAQSGYSRSLNYSNLSAGAHTLTLRAISSNGDQGDVTVGFNVAKFDFTDNFLSDPSRVDLTGATITHSGSTITIQNAMADGKPYNVQLNWRTATQDWDLTAVGGTGAGPTDLSGSYAVQVTFVSEDCAFAEPDRFATDGVDVLVLSQDGEQLTGTSSAGTLSVSGSVAANGDFTLSSPARSDDLGGGCTQTITLQHQGNLLAGTVESITKATFSGTCPATHTACQVVYQGTLAKTGAVRSLQTSDALYPAVLDALENAAR